MSTDITITKGLPFSRVIRVESARIIWAELDDFEIRSQLRQKAAVDSPLIADLHDYMTATYEDDDIVITWSMTGADTRALTSKGKYDVIVSDTGSVDARAIPVLSGSISLAVLTTAAED